MSSRSFKYALVGISFAMFLGFAQGQTNWQRFPGNPIVPLGTGTPAFEQTFSPCVLYDSVAGIYKMWFSAIVVGGSTWNVSYATSVNGTSWEVYSGSPVLRVGSSGSFDSQWLIDPFVLRIGTGYRMYYTGYNGERWQTGLATSEDGITWTKHPGNPILRVISGSWESIGANCPKVYFNGSTYTMMYSGYNGANYSIGLATSTDGITFTRHPSNPVLRKGSPSEWDANSVFMNSFVHYNGKFYLLYNGGPYAPVGFATSTNGGVSWAKYPGNPVFTTGAPGSWDESRLTVGSLIVTGSEFRYWYTGYSWRADKWQIGYATGSIAPPITMSDTVALYHFDETNQSNVIDSSPYGNHGTAYSTTIVPGISGNARRFSGSNSYAFFTNPFSLNFDTSQSFTIELWFKTTQQNVGEIIRRGLAPLPGFAIRILNGKVQGIIGNREDSHFPDTLLRITSAQSYNDGAWHHATMVRDKSLSRLFLYVDGVQAAPSINDPVPFALSSARPLTIGCWENFVEPAFFDGTIDEVKIYRSARHGSSPPTIQISVEAMNFGVVPVGSSPTQGLGVSNLSFSDTLWLNAETNNSVFVSSLPVTFFVPPGQSRTIPVTYIPTEAHVDTGSLFISSNDPFRPIVRVRLNGQGFAPTAAPLVSSVRDIPEDQGKQVRVSWYRSIYDGVVDSLHVTEYNLWRKVAGAAGLWDFVVTVPAVQFLQYSYVTPTLFDSTRFAGIRWSVFRVSAHTANGAEVFFSPEDSGYSVDNLPPAQPTNLFASVGAGQVSISWDQATDPDVIEYAVYRSNFTNFIPSESNRIGSPITNSFIDRNISGSPRWYYRIAALDSAGNQGTCSEELAVVLTDIDAGATLPTVFALHQNYPNPFNPSSIIRFDVPQSSLVTIRVYDMLGREVATLVYEVMSIGQHSTTWNAGGLSSGFYVYRMTAGSFTATKKMILMK